MWKKIPLDSGKGGARNAGVYMARKAGLRCLRWLLRLLLLRRLLLGRQLLGR